MIDLGPEICKDLAAAEQREWLITNGMGGFASGTVAGVLTRRYHALLVAPLKPPLGRTLLVTKIDELAEYDGEVYALGANRWVGGAIDPRGYEFIERFRLEGTIPVWTFAFADALLEKRIWMEHGANTTYVTYTLARANHRLRLTLKVLVNYRDFHSVTRAGDWRMDVQRIGRGVRVLAFPGAAPIYLLSPQAEAEATHIWYRNYDLAVERGRGLEDHEDHLHAANFTAEIGEGESATVVLSTDATADLDASAALERRLGHERKLIEQWSSTHPSLGATAPFWVRQLVLAADQFIVARPLAENPQAYSVIAGYPWFGDWGRDTMVALPGLTLSIGRAEIAKEILRTFAKFVSEGMLPNFFPEAGNNPEYNAVDGTLWYIEAVSQYVAATRDTATLRELYPVLSEMINRYVRGTRFHIHVDRADGLLYAGEPGVALTWMDARVNGQPVTPRIGKPVEVNALWFNALLAMARLARRLKKSATYYENMAARAHEGFQRFWNDAAHYCFDVLDGPEGHDPAIRPNQIFAVSLADGLLPPEQMRAVVDACERHLLVPRGLRSLAPNHPQYRGHYAGPPHERDAAYHQGTVWGWLLGPFVLAHLRVYRDPARARAFLEPMAQAMTEAGLGTVGEIFDGDPPYSSRGCIAQAWSVAEVLRAWTAVASGKQQPSAVSLQQVPLPDAGSLKADG